MAEFTDQRLEQLIDIQINLEDDGAPALSFKHLARLIGEERAAVVHEAHKVREEWRKIPFISEPMMDEQQQAFWEGFQPLFKEVVWLTRAKKPGVKTASKYRKAMDALDLYANREFTKLTEAQKALFRDRDYPGRATGTGYDAQQAFLKYKERQFMEAEDVRTTLAQRQSQAIGEVVRERVAGSNQTLE